MQFAQKIDFDFAVVLHWKDMYGKFLWSDYVKTCHFYYNNRLKQ